MLRVVHLICKHPRWYFVALSLGLYVAFARGSVLRAEAVVVGFLFAVSFWFSFRFLYRMLLGQLAAHVDLRRGEGLLRRIIVAKSTLLLAVLPVSLVVGVGSGSSVVLFFVLLGLLVVAFESISRRAQRRLGVSRGRMRRALLVAFVMGMVGPAFLLMTGVFLFAGV